MFESCRAHHKKAPQTRGFSHSWGLVAPRRDTYSTPKRLDGTVGRGVLGVRSLHESRGQIARDFRLHLEVVSGVVGEPDAQEHSTLGAGAAIRRPPLPEHLDFIVIEPLPTTLTDRHLRPHDHGARAAGEHGARGRPQSLVF